MKIVAVIAAVLFVSSAALAGDLTPQQRKMKDCNAEAGSKGLQGEAHQKFMSACLSAKAPEKSAVRRKP
ncbi:MAG: PsiF family protein [Nitrospiraceae bacterium]